MANRANQRRDSMGRTRQAPRRGVSYQRTTGQRAQNFNNRSNRNSIIRQTRTPNINRTDRVVNSVMPNNNVSMSMRPPVGFTLQEYDYLVPAAAADCPQLGASYGYDAVDILIDICPQTSAVRQLRGQLEKDMNSGGDTIMWYFVWCLCCMAGTCPTECSRCPKRQREERENRER